VPTTVWIHGNSGVLQTSHGFLVEPLGYYLRLKAEFPASTWVHFAVPTTVDSDESRIFANAARHYELSGVRMRAITFGDMEIRAVHAWDGARQVIRYDGLRLRGGTDSGQERGNRDVTDIPELALEIPMVEITSGIGVSLLIEARRPLDAIALVAVGIDLVRPPGPATG
jgi:hypothetical protein